MRTKLQGVASPFTRASASAAVAAAFAFKPPSSSALFSSCDASVLSKCRYFQLSRNSSHFRFYRFFGVLALTSKGMSDLTRQAGDRDGVMTTFVFCYAIRCLQLFSPRLPVDKRDISPTAYLHPQCFKTLTGVSQCAYHRL